MYSGYCLFDCCHPRLHADIALLHEIPPDPNYLHIHQIIDIV